jgi:hypothetical protein
MKIDKRIDRGSGSRAATAITTSLPGNKPRLCSVRIASQAAISPGRPAFHPGHPR